MTRFAAHGVVAMDRVRRYVERVLRRDFGSIRYRGLARGIAVTIGALGFGRLHRERGLDAGAVHVFIGVTFGTLNARLSH